MEKRLNKKAELYITTFKDNIREKVTQMGLTKCEQMNHILQYIYDYDRLSFGKEDFQKTHILMTPTLISIISDLTATTIKSLEQRLQI